jgi:hypothetical protein
MYSQLVSKTRNGHLIVCPRRQLVLMICNIILFFYFGFEILNLGTRRARLVSF